MTRHNLPSHIQKLQLSVVLEVVEEIAVVVAIEAVAAEEAEPRPAHSPGRAPSIQIFPLAISSGVICILNGGKEVTFVLTLQAALGRISLLQSLQNEILTSPTKKK